MSRLHHLSVYRRDTESFKDGGIDGGYGGAGIDLRKASYDGKRGE